MDETTGQLLRLLDEFGARLHSLLTRLTLRQDVAEELLQDLFLKLQQSHGFCQSAQPERYLFRAAINLAFDWRRANRRWNDGVEFPEGEPAASRVPLDGLIQEEELELVLTGLERLSEADRELITLRFIHGESHDVLATRLGRTRHQVRALCSKAVTRLRRHVHNLSADEPQREVSDVQQS